MARFGIRLDETQSVGQWKLARTNNTEWNKRALVCPVTETGALNTSLTWPLCGVLVCKTPQPFSPEPVANSATLANYAKSAKSFKIRVAKNGSLQASLCRFASSFVRLGLSPLLLLSTHHVDCGS
jgi:hypothetical protein